LSFVVNGLHCEAAFKNSPFYYPEADTVHAATVQSLEMLIPAQLCVLKLVAFDIRPLSNVAPTSELNSVMRVKTVWYRAG
jgi:hypothetical protein